MIWQIYLSVMYSVPVIWQNWLSVDSVPVIWQNCLYLEEHASDFAAFVVPVIWQNCLYVEEHASDLAELSVCGQCASDLAE